ncbi:MAG: ABC transporter permease [Gammaproteobacteria bacterium]
MLQDKKLLSEDEKTHTIAGLSDLVSESKVHVKPSYHEKVAIGITLVILILGYVWGMYTRPFNFSRSGSLIIVTGIIFAALDLTGRLTLVDEWVIARLERVRPAVIPARSMKGQEKAHEKIKRREILEENITSGVKEATDKARVRLRFIEVTILVLGTLVYGFGDLIVVHWRF